MFCRVPGITAEATEGKCQESISRNVAASGCAQLPSRGAQSELQGPVMEAALGEAGLPLQLGDEEEKRARGASLGPRAISLEKSVRP